MKFWRLLCFFHYLHFLKLSKERRKQINLNVSPSDTLSLKKLKCVYLSSVFLFLFFKFLVYQGMSFFLFKIKVGKGVFLLSCSGISKWYPKKGGGPGPAGGKFWISNAVQWSSSHAQHTFGPVKHLFLTHMLGCSPVVDQTFIKWSYKYVKVRGIFWKVSF